MGAAGKHSSDTSGTFGAETTQRGVKFEMSPQSLYDSRTQSDTSPYLSDMRWLRMSAQMQEFDTYDETITFRHVSLVKTKSGAVFISGPKPLTVTTPSGVRVTLLDAQNQPAPQHARSGDENHTYNAEIQCTQTQTPAILPHSPFRRKYQRPVNISLDFPEPFGSYGESPVAAGSIYDFTRRIRRCIRLTIFA